MGNEKGKLAELEADWSIPVIQNAKRLAEKAVAAVGGLFYAGVDVVVSPDGWGFVIEVNAFGDMLLDIYKEGMNSYDSELRAWLEKESQG